MPPVSGIFNADWIFFITASEIVILLVISADVAGFMPFTVERAQNFIRAEKSAVLVLVAPIAIAAAIATVRELAFRQFYRLDLCFFLSFHDLALLKR